MVYTIQKTHEYNKVTLCNFVRDPAVDFYNVALWFPLTIEGEKKKPVEIGAKYNIHYSRKLHAYVVGDRVD